MNLPTYLFPAILIALDLCAAAVYGFGGDKVRAAYWVMAGGLTATTLWMK
jgi:hypothetical protein